MKVIEAAAKNIRVTNKTEDLAMGANVKRPKIVQVVFVVMANVKVAYKKTSTDFPQYTSILIGLFPKYYPMQKRARLETKSMRGNNET